MLFKSEIIAKTWDTWMVYHQGTYHLYYLTSENAVGDGFGVATSEDGIRWHDYGRVLSPSDKMVRYLGAGSVWKDVRFAETGRFLCNISKYGESVTEIGPATRGGTTFKCEERLDREIALGPSPRNRLLLRHKMEEFYLEDILIQCYTMESAADGRVGCRNTADLRLWHWPQGL
jgi:hypothetical protein